jgi:CcmD family protein
MASDQLTFFLSFLAVFAGLGAYLWHLDRTARRLEARLSTLEAAQPGHGPSQETKAATAKPKAPQPPA